MLGPGQLPGKGRPGLLRRWGDANEVSSIVGVAAPLQLQRYPAHERKISQPKWEAEPSLRSAAVALTISRKPSTVQHSFQKVGSFEAVKELEDKSRDGLVRVVLGVDIVRRSRGGRMDLRAFGLLKQTKDGSALPVHPLFGMTQEGDMLTRFVNLPDGVASQVVMAPGKFEGSSLGHLLVARPCIHFPPGFRWTATGSCESRCPGSRSFLRLFATLSNFAGLVGPRSRGEVGVRCSMRLRHFDDPSLSRGGDGRQSKGIARR